MPQRSGSGKSGVAKGFNHFLPGISRKSGSGNWLAAVQFDGWTAQNGCAGANELGPHSSCATFSWACPTTAASSQHSHQLLTVYR